MKTRFKAGDTVRATRGIMNTYGNIAQGARGVVMERYPMMTGGYGITVKFGEGRGGNLKTYECDTAIAKA